METSKPKKQNKTNESLLTGKIFMKNHMYTEAADSLKKAYAEGSMEAASKLGQLYMNHHFQNHERAFYWLNIAAEGQSREAQFRLSRFYEQNLLDKYDLKMAYKWLSRAAEQNEPHAMLHLAYWYHMGIYVPKDRQHALSLLEQLAGMGQAEALCLLGKEYEHGSELLAPDRDKAWEYYQRAALAHHPYALYRVGKYYWSRRLLSNNVQRAVDCLEESGARGCREAQYLLANICGTYFYHHVYDRYRWLLAAARNQHPEAMYDLGCLFLFGNSFLSADREQADYWFRKARENGVRKTTFPEMSLISDSGSNRFSSRVSPGDEEKVTVRKGKKR